ncbi:MAG: twin transmembrane helix small protein [Gammaproteobacteria bacterium]
MLIKVVVGLLLVLILCSLGYGMYSLINDKGETKKTVNALTLRISLSVALFLFLFLAWSLGWIQPHGIGAN